MPFLSPYAVSATESKVVLNACGDAIPGSLEFLERHSKSSPRTLCISTKICVAKITLHQLTSAKMRTGIREETSYQTGHGFLSLDRLPTQNARVTLSSEGPNATLIFAAL